MKTSDAVPLGRARGCSQHKLSYRTRQHALLIAAIHAKKYGDLLFPYWHAECEQYHLTRTPQTAEEARQLMRHLQAQQDLDSGR